MNVWYVNFPTFQYNEDVKELARKAGLRIVDAKFQGKNKQCEDAPKLTVKKDEAKIEAEKAEQAKEREALVIRATELGLEFAPNLGDKKLTALIAEAEKALENE